jgi:hypothetical protein
MSTSNPVQEVKPMRLRFIGMSDLLATHDALTRDCIADRLPRDYEGLKRVAQQDAEILQTLGWLL